jgi:tRNA1(Val) A37 N6-methylase TrmN6
MSAERALPVSEDAVLGGRLRLRQPLKGHRVGHDAILLAAASQARAGEHAVDLGAGVGAVGLALAKRIPGLRVTLVEIDPALAALAAENAALNGLADRVAAIAADATDTCALADAGLTAGSIDRVTMNPPFRDPARQNVSPDARRRLAHVAAPALVERLIASAAVLLKPHGVLTLIFAAERLAELLDALSGAFGDIAVLPVKPRADRDPIRVLVRAVKGGARGRSDRAALVLNDAENRPTAAAEAILRGGQTLTLAEE